ncbi:hypothetical protein DFJ77DRAFT_440705 [Powellomyces hirtus]|nr:hypothetical protein DFJ77DRAFT_440705 [Powellomyces hirtus]
MSWWASDRPATGGVHPQERKQLPGEHEREVDDPMNIWAGPPAPPPVSTFTSDYTPKPLTSHHPRRHPLVKDTPPHRPHATSLWILRGEEVLKKRGGKFVPNSSGDDGILPTATLPAQFTTTHDRDFQIPGFDASLSGVMQVKRVLEPEQAPPAGLHTLENDSCVQYSSTDLSDILSRAHAQKMARVEFGRRPAFVPREEDYHRSGWETFSDHKEWSGVPPLTRGEDFRRRQDIIGRTIKAGTSCGVAGK